MKIYLGALSAIEYLGDKEKEFTRSPFSPKPVVKKGDIIILEKIHGYNISKLLPSEWKLLEDKLIEVHNDTTLIEKIAELESYVVELEEVVSNIDLKDIGDSEKLESILSGLEDGSLELDSLSEYDRALYDNHLNNTLSTSSNGILEEKLIIGADEALSEKSTIKPIEEFNNDKDELETYALENFGLELDKRKSFAKMYATIVSTLETNK